MAKTSEKVPIYDDEAEAHVIASIVLEPSYLAETDLDPEDFFIDDYRHLFEAILSLRERGAEINQANVTREASPKVGNWVLPKITAEALPIECLYYADIVKELSRQRKLVGSVENTMKEFRKQRLSSQELADRLRLCLNSLDFPTNSSRVITVSNPRIIQASPPVYELTVSTTNGTTSADIKVTSADLDKPLVFRRKVREHLKINPLLPKQFDAFIHQLLQHAQTQLGPKDASTDENICFWIREWFTTAVEAEHHDDLAQGYLNRDGALWFSSERLIKYISERTKIKIDPSSFWAVIHDRGGRRSKVLSIANKKVRLWGLDKSFFEEEEPADSEQMPLEQTPEKPPIGKDDLKWLEGGK